MSVELHPVEGLPEVRPGDDLGALLADRFPGLHDGDVVVVAQKVVSKAEGAIRDLADVTPSERAHRIATRLPGGDPRLVQLVLDESVRIVRDERVLIVETRHGFVCANAGIDRSNVPGRDCVSLLPADSDESAERLRRTLREITGASVGVVVSDTFGRPWRTGLCNVALGVAGIPAVIDHRGSADDSGRTLHATVIAVADGIAAAAELLMGKTLRIPVVVVRGLTLGGPAGRGRDLLRPPDEDLFR